MSSSLTDDDVLDTVAAVTRLFSRSRVAPLPTC